MIDNKGSSRYKTISLLLDKVKDAIDPYIFYCQELPMMSRKGATPWRIGGLCPFHDDKRPGSFYVQVDSGAFHCFSCGASGHDIISFVCQRHRLDFLRAVRKIAADWGL